MNQAEAQELCMRSAQMPRALRCCDFVAMESLEQQDSVGTAAEAADLLRFWCGRNELMNDEGACCGTLQLLLQSLSWPAALLTSAVSWLWQVSCSNWCWLPSLPRDEQQWDTSRRF